MTVNRNASERTALYRMFDAGRALLYIGVSNNFGYRWKQHASAQSWWPEVQRQTVEWYPNRKDAEAAEVAAIKAEGPRHNITHSAVLSRETFSAGKWTVDGATHVRPSQMRVHFRAVLNEVEHEGVHIFVLRYDKPSAVIVSVEWFEQARAALTTGAAAS